AAFAAGTSHAPGTARYARPAGPGTGSCAPYADAAAAQQAFLAAGGPQQDALGLDADGDGFVCGFDPAPYRS
ncbi:hypothetical protein ICN82_18935, partial [Mangrovicoccus sp. HB182678]|nr:hypothetical protein [Mangrovicoccus algicola]